MTVHAEVVARILAHGMVPVFDTEGLYWADGAGDTGWPGLIGSGAWDVFLGEILAAGWAGTASEGMYGPDCEHILAAGLSFISYGGDQGETLYEGECATGIWGTVFCGSSRYRHPADGHTGNYIEMYCGTDPSVHYDACRIAARYTPDNMGLTIGLWSTYRLDGGPTVATNGAQLVGVIGELRGMGVNIKTVLWWAGWAACPDGIFSTYAASYDAVAAAFGTERSRFPAP